MQYILIKICPPCTALSSSLCPLSYELTTFLSLITKEPASKRKQQNITK